MCLRERKLIAAFYKSIEIGNPLQITKAYNEYREFIKKLPCDVDYDWESEGAIENIYRSKLDKLLGKSSFTSN